MILTVNAGSSSIRLALYQPDGRTRIRDHHQSGEPDPAPTLQALAGGATPAVIAHRVVHGGPTGTSTRVLDEPTAALIARMIPLAPLHNPATLAWVEACRRLWPQAIALAVYDSTFFAGLPAVAATYALPAALRDRLGLRRLGFHGLAHRSMWEAWSAGRPGAGRVISFQLGSGCSVAALRDGAPIDTSMGFSPLEGLVMATRPGDVDPGIIVHLLGAGDLGAAELVRTLHTASGLAALGGSGDVRQLLADPSPRAALALDVYAYRARKYLGAYVAALGGCDAVLLGGGVGEHAPAIRRRILGGLEALGIALDDAANEQARAPAKISAAGSAVEVWVVPTDEEAVLAREAAEYRRAEGRG